MKNLLDDWKDEDNHLILNTLIKAEGNKMSLVIFAIANMLDIPHEPKVDDISKYTLYGNDIDQYKNDNFVIAPSEEVNNDLILEQESDVKRFIATIKLKYTPVEPLLIKFCRGKSHPIYKAIREYGKMIRSIYLLKYINGKN